MPYRFMESGQSPIKILLIEDDPIDCVLYRQCLQQAHAWEFEFATAESASAGIALCQSWEPDCALLDVNLPDTDGIEVINRLKDENGRLPCAFIMLTAFGSEEIAVRAMKAGAMDFLLKRHLSPSTLAHTVMHAIDRFRMQERIEEQRAALERSRLRYQTLLEAIPQMVWTTNAAGRMEYANRRWIEYTGLPVESTDRLDWDALLHADDVQRTTTAWNRAAATGSLFEIEHRLRRAKDATFRWHLVRAVPMHGASGEITNWFGTGTDIEDQKRADEQLRHQQKMQGMGVLAGGLAHDFNNLLVAIMGGATLAMDTLPPSHTAQNMLQIVVQAGEQAAELTRKMLAYAGLGQVNAEVRNVGDVVCDACDRMRSNIPKTVWLECSTAKGLPSVETDVRQLQQAVVDLVTNSVEAMPEGQPGRISVRTWRASIAEECMPTGGFLTDSIRAGDYVVVEVQDTGCGMNDETRRKIFDPFFSTKFLGRGLGLSAVHGFIRSNRGTVQVESAPGQGTTIRLLLPSAAEKATPCGLAN